MPELNTILSTTLRALREDPDISENKKQQLISQITTEVSPLQNDRWIYRVVVGSLGLAVLLTITFTFFIYLSASSANPPREPKIPDIFLALGSAAVGALAGLLAPSPTSR